MMDQLIDTMEAELVQSVCESVSIESTKGPAKEGAPFGTGPAKALAHALSLAEQMGFKTKNIGGAIGYAEFGTGDEMIAVLGHLDVVPAGDLALWSVPPFQATQKEGFLWGRGTQDNKGPIIGALYALKAIAESGLPLKRRIRVVFGTDEESGSEDIGTYLCTEETPVMAFTPDASYPVIFSEKGIVQFRISKRVMQAGSNVRLLSCSGGKATNIVPADAVAIVTVLGGAEHKRSAIGKAAHGSTPQEGENAIADLLEQLREFSFAKEIETFFDFLRNKIGRETNGQSLGIAIKDDKFGDLTLNLGTLDLQQIGSGEEELLTARIDVRYPASMRMQDIWEAVGSAALQAGIEVTVERGKDPLYVPEDSVLVSTLQRVYAEQTGQLLPPVAIGGGTYAKALENTVAFGPLFPGQEDLMHQADERISVEYLIKTVKLTAAAMVALAK